MKQRITFGTIPSEDHARHGSPCSDERQSLGPGASPAELILGGPHELVLSEFILAETARVLEYPRLQRLFKLTPADIAEHVALLRARADLVPAVVIKPVVLTDPDDDPIVYTAVVGRVNVLCAVDRDFYGEGVVAFCGERGIEIMDDVKLLQRLETS